jgi:hypothetical protein
MEFSSENDVARRDLAQRLKGSAVSMSLTLMSIIQGVALADLAAVVANSYARFGPTQWLLALASFLVIIAAWNQVAMDTLTWSVMPNLSGTLVPFGVGAVELFLNHALDHGEQVWLIGAALIAVASSIGIINYTRGAARFPENAAILAHLRTYRASGQRYNTGGAVLLLVLAAAALAGGFTWLDALVHLPNLSAIVAAVLANGFLFGFLSRHLTYWQVVLAFALNDPSLGKHKHRT